MVIENTKKIKMFSRIFQAHGHFCAAHPWEVIIATLTITMCLMSMSLFTSGEQTCGWRNYACPQEKGVSSSDVVIISVTRCLSVMYIYLQFRNLRNLGSKYLILISGVFTIFSSFVFSIAVLKIFGNDLSGLTEALPFFLLLIDLSKSCALAKFALRSSCQEDVKERIGQGMAQLGPALTLDAIVETLVIGLGTLSGVRQLETMCCFGCLSVLANFLAFMSFYPACLALFFEVARNRNHGKPLLHLQQLTLKQDIDCQKPNPVTQRIKIIMSAGLALVHAHSRWNTGTSTSNHLGEILGTKHYLQQSTDSDIPLWLFYVHTIVTVNADYTLTLVLAVFLTVKYMFYEDENADIELLTKDYQSLKSNSSTFVKDDDETDISTKQFNELRDVKFSVGESDSSSEDEIERKCTIGTQTEWHTAKDIELKEISSPRPLAVCVQIMKSDAGPSVLSDEEVILLVKSKYIPAYKLEAILGDCERGVSIRRQILASDIHNSQVLDKLPYLQYDHYDIVNGACCENVIGYIPIPVGIAGPLLLNGEKYHIPMATTEGCLLASTNRGCRVLMQSGGVQSTVIKDGMTRAPVIRLPNARRASQLKVWLEDKDNFELVKESFDGTSRFARLESIQPQLVGRYAYIRFVATTGDAMGMNMLSKGSERALLKIKQEFSDLEILSLSGNYCTDKKPSAVNWIEGRGKSVICDAVIPGHVVKNTLKTSVTDLVELNVSKNYMGSARAGSIGGFNAHAANVVTAIFIATGQDPAQNVTSCNCITVMEPTGPDNNDLYISCTMPSIEVGTVGGGTILPPQSASLQLLGIQGSSAGDPGENARKLASIVCGTVLAGELSLMSALAAGHLVRSHMKHNRSALSIVSNEASSPVINNSKVSSNTPSPLASKSCDQLSSSVPQIM